MRCRPTSARTRTLRPSPAPWSPWPKRPDLVVPELEFDHHGEFNNTRVRSFRNKHRHPTALSKAAGTGTNVRFVSMLVVTGTGTGVGKTVVTAAIAALAVE